MFWRWRDDLGAPVPRYDGRNRRRLKRPGVDDLLHNNWRNVQVDTGVPGLEERTVNTMWTDRRVLELAVRIGAALVELTRPTRLLMVHVLTLRINALPDVLEATDRRMSVLL
jgi:hypothetical protein